MAEQNFGPMNFYNSQPVFGDHNEVTQNNYYGDQRDEIARRLADLRALPGAAAVEPQIVVIEKAIEAPTPSSLGQLEHALATVRTNLGNIEGALVSTGAIAAIVAQHWPF